MKYENRRHMAMNFVMIFIIFIICFSAGYAMSQFIFRLFGTPSPFLAYMIAGVFATLLFSGIAKVMSKVILKGHNDGRMTLFNQMVEALGKIAHGDFNVFVETYDHDPFYEVAESVNKMAAELGALENQRQDFISNVSHEIQSPLTSIGGFATLLKSASLTESERIHYLDIIETESKRLSRLSDNLLKLSHLEAETAPLVKQEFRLDKQISNAVLMLEPQWSDKHITIEVELDKITVNADEELLGRIWINLLHNAIKFTPENGKIEISLTDSDGIIECRIKDTGIGILPTDQMHIFERFYKVDKARDRSLGGNGLGLSLCKKIVELHDGIITLNSEPGKGTTFIVRLHSV